MPVRELDKIIEPRLERSIRAREFKNGFIYTLRASSRSLIIEWLSVDIASTL